MGRLPRDLASFRGSTASSSPTCKESESSLNQLPPSVATVSSCPGMNLASLCEVLAVSSSLSACNTLLSPKPRDLSKVPVLLVRNGGCLGDSRDAAAAHKKDKLHSEMPTYFPLISTAVDFEYLLCFDGVVCCSGGIAVRRFEEQLPPHLLGRCARSGIPSSSIEKKGG